MDEVITIRRQSSWRLRLANYLSIEKNVSIASAGLFIIGLGEELWKKFLPKYLEALGANTQVIGLFGTAENFLDAIYQYPGGWLADHVGRRRSMLILILCAMSGYVVYLVSPSWPLVFVGLALVMAWQSMASPAIFAVIADSLPREQRAMGFTLQSILKRIPIVVSPIAGGILIVSLGTVGGIQAGLAITLVLSLLSALLITRVSLAPPVIRTTGMVGVWRSFRTTLKRLLISDVIVRTCEAMTGVLTILYVTNIQHVTVTSFATLVSIQVITSIVVYLPAAKLADRVGRKPLVIFTFVSFALFPLLIIAASGFAALVLAFIIGGLREIGEPARKAMIVDFAEDGVRARSVGLYYLVRSLSITPAAAIGGLLWNVAPEVPFVVAALVGIAGTLVFAMTVEERYAS